MNIDRTNLNVAIRPGYEYLGFIHWDYDLENNPQQVQGVLALNDQTDPDMGGFQCIPWLYRDYREWVKTNPVRKRYIFSRQKTRSVTYIYVEKSKFFKV